MNYCTSCHRELNGVLSCPGCGASVDSIPSAQNSTSVVWMHQPAGGGQDLLPTPASHGAPTTAAARTAADRSRAMARARAHAAPSSVLFGGTTSAEPDFFQDSDSAAGTRYGSRGRHSHRRRSLAPQSHRHRRLRRNRRHRIPSAEPPFDPQQRQRSRVRIHSGRIDTHAAQHAEHDRGLSHDVQAANTTRADSPHHRIHLGGSPERHNDVHLCHLAEPVRHIDLHAAPRGTVDSPRRVLQLRTVLADRSPVNNDYGHIRASIVDSLLHTLIRATSHPRPRHRRSPTESASSSSACSHRHRARRRAVDRMLPR